MPAALVEFRPASTEDLPAVNAVVEACVMGWHLPSRVKRLALGSYLYGSHDFAFMDIVLAEQAGNGLAGVAALEAADPADLPAGIADGLLLHGLYVAPAWQRKGIGTQLVEQAMRRVRDRNLGGLLVKAQREAVEFFQTDGFIPLAVDNPATDYADRWWKPA